MKMKRNLIMLGIVAVLAIALVIVAPKLKPGGAGATATPAPTTDPATVTLSNVTVDKVSEVTVSNDKQTYTMVKNGDKYVIQGQESLALDQTAAGDVFYNAASIIGEKLIGQNFSDLSPYGLDKPQAKVVAKYTDGTTATYLVGSMTSAGNTYYFMKQGDPRVITVWMNIGTTYLNSADALLQKQKIQLAQEDIEHVKVVKDGVTTVELSSTEPEGKVSISPWLIVKPWRRAVDSTELDTFLKAVIAVSMGDVVEGNPTDLSKYGLDKPKYDVTISGKGKTDELLIGADKDTTYTYVKFASNPTVYTVDKSTLTFVSTSAYKLMDKMIILVNISSALGVEFQGFGQQGKMVIEQVLQTDDTGATKKDTNGNPVYDQKFTVNGTAVDDKVARYFYQICIGLATHSQIDPAKVPAAGTTPLATLTYTRNADPKEIKIEFLPYDEDFYAVRMDGSTDFLITQDQVKTVADDLAKLEAGTLTVPQ